MAELSRTRLAKERMDRARRYTLSTIDDFQPDEWFADGGHGVTHLAWQMGHLAVAEWQLALVRVRGKRAEDEALVPADYIKRFGRGSTPDPNPANNPTPAELVRIATEVHEAAMAELAVWEDADLDVALEQEHPMFRTRLEAVEFASLHELTHAGQIGLIRRLLGKQPLR